MTGEQEQSSMGACMGVGGFGVGKGAMRRDTDMDMGRDPEGTGMGASMDMGMDIDMGSDMCHACAPPTPSQLQGSSGNELVGEECSYKPKSMSPQR